MVLLKKIRAATLVESLVSSVIIIVVFVYASLSMNNIFKGAIKANDSQYKNRLKELRYLVSHNKIKAPFYEETPNWDISIQSEANYYKMITINKVSSEELILEIKP